MAQSARRGRLPTAEREARRDEILDAAEAELVDNGYDGTTMLAVARRAGASKETLYRWFGDREGLWAAVVARNAAESAAAVEHLVAPTVDGGRGDLDDHRTVLTTFATALLSLLTGPRSVALNRAAMTSPELAEVLLAGGRHTVGPLVEELLAALDERGDIAVPDPATAFQVLYGLVVRDRQIRVLLGEDPPPPATIRREAGAAVDQFLTLYAVTDPTRVVGHAASAPDRG